ncbi:MAG TPA: UrcA family protein [Sphingomicrobium sp.]|nr:UrcA family protein [Sphingomicrobium sp.]
MSIASATTAALIFAAASAANAREIVVARHLGKVFTERVAYADLDLASRGGVRMLNARVSGAVGRVCLSADSVIRANCANYAWKDARPQINGAIKRAQQLAATGATSVVPVALSISISTS